MNRHNERSLRWTRRAPGVAVGVGAAWLVLAAAAAPPVAAENEHVLGEWVDPPGGDDWGGFVPKFAALLPDGKVLIWRATYTCDEESERIWNSQTGDFTTLGSEDTDHARCSGFAHLKTGSILSAGGVCSGSSDQATEYSFTGNEWVSRATLDIGRFYPSLTRLSDGRVIATLGDNPPDWGGIDPMYFVDVPERYDPEAETWTTLTSATHPAGGLTNYPHIYILPFDDLLFQAGPNTGTFLLDLAAGTNGEWDDTPLDDPAGYGAFSARTAMYEPGVILKCGGAAGDPSLPVPDTLFIDFNDTTPEWLHIDEQQSVYEMIIERQWHNAVLLPGGRIMAVNGIWRPNTLQDYEYVKSPEWIDTNDFASGWSDLADETYDRGIGPHYLALLLPSAEVLVCGGGPDHSDMDKAEIFSPPYLFKANDDPADRPTIGSAPTRVIYGSEFKVFLAQSSTVLAGDISMISLMGLPAVTHGFDQNQRHVSLTFEVGGDYVLSVTAPANGNIAPPGYYMLFLVGPEDPVTLNRPPSEAVFIQFGPE